MSMREGQMGKKKASFLSKRGFLKFTATTYYPTITAVPSALMGLTSLFGMGRGGHHRYNHHKYQIGR